MVKLNREISGPRVKSASPASLAGRRAGPLKQLLEDPLGDVAAIPRVDVAEHLQLREQQRPVRADPRDEPVPVERVPHAQNQVHDVATCRGGAAR